MKQALKIVFVSALATAALIKGVPALAEPAGEVAVSVVRTADIDLSSREGQRRLEQRLVIAAHAVCDTASAVDLKATNDEADCRKQVIASAKVRAQEIAAGTRDDRSIRIAARH